jgi:hypothetical protein
MERNAPMRGEGGKSEKRGGVDEKANYHSLSIHIQTVPMYRSRLLGFLLLECVVARHGFQLDVCTLYMNRQRIWYAMYRSSCVT